MRVRWWRRTGGHVHLRTTFGQVHVPLCRQESERGSQMFGHLPRARGAVQRRVRLSRSPAPHKACLVPSRMPGANSAPHALLTEAGQGSSPEGGQDERTWHPFRALQDQLLPGPTARDATGAAGGMTEPRPPAAQRPASSLPHPLTGQRRQEPPKPWPLWVGSKAV